MTIPVLEQLLRGGVGRDVWREGGEGGMQGGKEGGWDGGRQGGREEGGREGTSLCIAMRRNVLFDRWMPIMAWVHIAWNGCISRNRANHTILYNLNHIGIAAVKNIIKRL